MKRVIYMTLFFITISCSNDDNGGNTPMNNQSPGAFNLISIADQAVNVGLLPEFSWETAVDPDGDTVTYDFILTAGENTKTIADITTTSYVLPIEDKLALDTSYSWKVIAKDEQGASTESAAFIFTTTIINTAKEIPEELGSRFKNYSGFATVVYDGKIWTVGGYDNISLQYKNTVFSSTDGMNWAARQTSPNPDEVLPPRSGHELVVFKDKMYVIGGRNDSGYLNDVWSSTDGQIWTEEKTDLTGFTRFSGRSRHKVVVFNEDILVLIGGAQGTTGLSDMWSSSDGKNWIKGDPSGDVALPTIYGHQAIAFNGKIWIFGGSIGLFTNVQNIWTLGTGGVLEKITPPETFFSIRSGHQVVVYDNKIWLIGGTGLDLDSNFGERLNDIWYSSNGTDWTLVREQATFLPRTGHQTEVFQDAMWILGGSIEEEEKVVHTNEIWVMDTN